VASVSFSFRIDPDLDPDICAWLQGADDRGILIRKALRHYLDLPPRDEAPPVAPAPGSGVDAELMNKLLTVLNKLDRKLDSAGSIPIYNNRAAPEPDDDPALADATDAFITMFG
jgi:hypothetical protein